MVEQTIPEEFKRNWVKGEMFVTFTYDYLRDSIPANKIEFQIVNVSGENMNRVFRKAGSVTGAEATAIRNAMKREMDNQVIDIANGYIPFPELALVVPSSGDSLAGALTIQIECLSKTLGEMTVEWRLNAGAWQSTTYNATSKYYEDSVDTTAVPDGSHVFEIRASNGNGVLLIIEPFNILVDNS